MDVFFLSIIILLHPMYGIYLLCKKRYTSAVLRMILPFLTLYCLNVHTIGYRAGQSSMETFRQSLVEGNMLAYLGVLSAFLWLVCILLDIRKFTKSISKKMDVK